VQHRLVAQACALHRRSGFSRHLQVLPRGRLVEDVAPAARVRDGAGLGRAAAG
jgi:hypothetical protein